MLKKGKIFNILLSLLILLLALLGCNGGGSPDDSTTGGDNTVTLAWEVLSTDVGDITGYNVYYGKESNNYTELEDVEISMCQDNGGITECTYTIENVTSGRWYFALTSYDTSANESNYSNEVYKDIN